MNQNSPRHHAMRNSRRTFRHAERLHHIQDNSSGHIPKCRLLSVCVFWGFRNCLNKYEHHDESRRAVCQDGNLAPLAPILYLKVQGAKTLALPAIERARLGLMLGAIVRYESLGFQSQTSSRIGECPRCTFRMCWGIFPSFRYCPHVASQYLSLSCLTSGRLCLRIMVQVLSYPLVISVWVRVDFDQAARKEYQEFVQRY